MILRAGVLQTTSFSRNRPQWIPPGDALSDDRDPGYTGTMSYEPPRDETKANPTPEDEHRALDRLLTLLHRALRDFAMIPPGAKVALAVSGGRDSLVMARLLDRYRQERGGDFFLRAIHVTGHGADPEAERPHAPLLDRLEAWGIPIVAVPLAPEPDEPRPLSCARCARLRRKALCLAARKMDCPVVALGHHADDLVETALMNLIHHGRLEGLNPARDWFGGTVRMIRPLIYFTRRRIHRTAERLDLPPPPPECPVDRNGARRFAADLARRIRKAHPPGRSNLFRGALKAMGYPVKPRGKHRPALD